MSAISALADGAISLLGRFASKTTVLVTVGPAVVTAGGLEQAVGSLSGFLSAFQAAVKAKNYGLEVELGIDEAATVAADFGIPYAGLAATALPFVFGLINSGVLPLTTQPVDGTPDGLATRQW